MEHTDYLTYPVTSAHAQYKQKLSSDDVTDVHCQQNQIPYYLGERYDIQPTWTDHVSTDWEYLGPIST
jgi:hypothetical protein